VPRYVLDTSALMTVLNAEPGTETLLEILDAAGAEGETGEAESSTILMPFLALMEVEYLILRKLGADAARHALSLLKAWPVELVESSETWRREAARIKASFPLSVADAWICSLATLKAASLVHKDPEFDAVAGLNSLRLPYKGKPRER
jgi:predicted nucleic acid-binding protein